MMTTTKKDTRKKTKVCYYDETRQKKERNVTMKPSTKKLKYFIKDEKHASKEYRKYGLPCLAKDEAKHRRILTRMLKKKQGK